MDDEEIETMRRELEHFREGCISLESRVSELEKIICEMTNELHYENALEYPYRNFGCSVFVKKPRIAVEGNSNDEQR